jgi:hypothetical protein
MVVVAASSHVALAAGDGGAPAWLVWRSGDGTAECPSARGFADKVEQRLHASADEAARRQAVTIAVELGRTPAGLRGWRARLQVNRAADGSPIGSRSLEQEEASCESVVEVVSFFATLVLSGAPAAFDNPRGPSLAGPLEPAGPGPAPAPAPVAPPVGLPDVPAPSPDSPVSPPPSPALPAVRVAAAADRPAAAPPRWTAAVDAGPIVALGLLPGVSYGAQASASFGPPGGMRARVGLALWPDRRSQPDASTGADANLVMMTFGLCPLSARGTGRVLQGCLGGGLGRLSAKGVGADASSGEQSHVIFDLSAGARLEQTIVGRLFAAVEARAEVPLLRVRIVYAGPAAGEVREVFRMQPVAAVGQLQVGWRFSP